MEVGAAVQRAVEPFINQATVDKIVVWLTTGATALCTAAPTNTAAPTKQYNGISRMAN